MPTRIIERRLKEAPCCGGSFLKNMLIFGGQGEVEPPCTPTIIDIVTGGDFSNPADWTFQDVGNGQTGIIAAGELSWPQGSLITDGYFQSIPSLDSTKTYELTITKINFNFGDPSPTIFLLFHSGDGNGTFGTLTGVDGIYTTTVPPGAWTPGPNAAWATYGLTPTDFGVLIAFNTNGTPHDGGSIDNFSMTYEECI